MSLLVRHRSSRSSARPAWLLPVALLVCVVLSGCAATRAPRTMPVEMATDVETAPLDRRMTQLELFLIPEDEVETGPFEQTQIEDPLTASPLDELAEMNPELTPDAAAVERELVAARQPTFDIPIEVNDRVLAWVDVYSNRLKPYFEQNLARSGKYLEMFREIFAERGLPRDLVYMAAVESGYKTSAYSRARARGIFQFIAPTARRYGLRVDYWVDERSDPELSARAAAAYMEKLYDEFGDWYLALAAYNAGEGTIRRAIRRTGQSDFWALAKTGYLRRETKNHVPAILAATLLSKEPEKYGLRYEPQPELRYDTVKIEGGADLRVLALCSGSDVPTLKELNPALRRYQTPPEGTTDLRVPLGTGETTRAALDAIPVGERVLYARYQVRRGDTLSVIARNFGVTVSAIQSSNQMGRSTLIREKQILRIPTSASDQYGDLPAPVDGGELLVYRVHRGDTLYGIARRYGTTPNAIAAASGISVHDLLQVGQHVRVVRGVTSPAEARRIVDGGSTYVATAGSTHGNALVHTVRSGDTLWQLAKRYDTSVNKLCAWNRISPRATIHPGVQLTVGYK